MNIITCISDINPCPVADQRLLSLVDALDPVSLGVDASTIAFVYGAGAAVIAASALLGYGAAVAIHVIRQI